MNDPSFQLILFIYLLFLLSVNMCNFQFNTEYKPMFLTKVAAETIFFVLYK